MNHIVLCGLLLVATFASSAWAEPGAEARARGRAIAVTRCGPCHATDTADRSPHPTVRPLRAIASAGANPMLEAARTTGTIAGHDEMPEFEFTPDDAQALIGYIESLSPTRARPAK